MNELPPKQAKVFEILVRHARRGEPGPTYRQIAQELRCDVRSAYQHIEALEKKGVVARTGAHRGIQLEREFMPPRGVPVIGRVAAGVPITAEQNVDEYLDVGTAVAEEDAFLLKVRGDSMVDKKIFDGDFVLVRPQMRLEQGEIGVVCVDGNATVKEVNCFRDRVILVSHNSTRAYPDQVTTNARMSASSARC